MQSSKIAEMIAFARTLIGVGPNSDTQRYLEMTEGRQDWVQDGQKRKYAWCGDYVTFVLSRAGVQDGTLLNRAEINGKWLPGGNIAMIIAWAQKRGVWRTNFHELTDGSIYVQKRDAGDHIGFVADASLATVTTLDGNSYYNVVAQNQKAVNNATCHGFLRCEDIPCDDSVELPGLWGLPMPAQLPLPWLLPTNVAGTFEETIVSLANIVESVGLFYGGK